MKIHALIDRLRASEKEKRRYRSETHYSDRIQAYIKRCEFLDGQKHFADRFRMVKKMGKDGWEQFDASHFFVYGQSDFTELQAWYDPLPEDFVEFYRHIRAGMLCFENFVWLMPLDEMLANELEHRRMDAAYDPDLQQLAPLRLLRFGDRGNDIAFGLRNYDGHWNIVPVSSEVADGELEGSEGEKYVCDDSFTTWLERMLDTEGNPASQRYRKPGEKDRWTYAKRIG